MTPAPMHSMLERQTKDQAVEKRNKRKSMIVQDVPATAPGIFLVLTFYYGLCKNTSSLIELPARLFVY